MKNVKPRILILEDEEDISHRLHTDLTDQNYNVVGIAVSYDEAMKITQNHKPDLALCDIKIQGYKDGIETAEEIKTKFNIPIIFLTAYMDHLLMQRALETNPASYLLKSIEENQLDIAIRLALFNHTHAAINSFIAQPQDKTLFVWVDGVFKALEIEDIIFMEAEDMRTYIYTRDEVYLLKCKNLKKVIESIHHMDIVRVHRQYAIHIKKIIEFDRALTYVKMNDEKKSHIDIGETYRENLKHHLIHVGRFPFNE